MNKSLVSAETAEMKPEDLFERKEKAVRYGPSGLSGQPHLFDIRF